MIIEQLDLHNFMCHKDTKIIFKDGIWLITGENGAGKSTIFDAITFALYGKTRGDIDSIIRNGQSECKVILKFSIDGNRIVINRHRGKLHSTLNINYENGDASLNRPTIAENQKKIEEIIGLNYDMFISSVYFGRENIANFINKTPKDRKQLLFDMLGLEIYKLAEIEVRIRISKAEIVLESCKIKHKDAEEVIESCKQKIKEINYSDEELGRKKSEIFVMENRINSLNGLKSSKFAILNKYDLLCDIAKNKEDNDLRLMELKENIKEISKNIMKDSNKIETMGEKEIKKQLDKIRVILKTCPTCGSPIRDREQEKKEKELENKLRDIEKFKDRITGMGRELTFMEREYKTLKEGQEKAVKQMQQYGNMLEEKTRDDLQQEIKTVESEIIRVKAKRDEVNQEVFEAFKKKTISEQAKQAMELHQARLKETEIKIRKIEIALKDYKILLRAFSRDGIPSYIIENILPELEEESNKFINQLMDEPFKIIFNLQKKTKVGKTKDTFDIKILSDIGERDFNSCSGGEKVRISVAIRLAISSFLSKRSGTDIKFLLVDELEYLDTSGLEKFVDIVYRIKKRFNIILIISHLRQLRESFKNCITIEKNINGSKIIGG